MAVGQHHFGIEAAAGHIQARIDGLERGDELAIARELALGGKCQCVALEPLPQIVLGSLQERAIQRVSGKGQKCDQTQTGREHLARLQRA